MLNRVADYYPPGIDCYVPAMKYAAELSLTHKVRVNFGAPPVADPDGILDAQAITTAGETSTFAAAYTEENMSPFGRNVTVVGSGAATSLVTVHGEDYLGQAMSEALTLNGTTPVVGLKAFKRVKRVVFGATSAVTIDVGWGAKLGLPYKTSAVEREFEDNVPAAAGTLAQPVLTDPATPTTGDPRGTYITTGTLDGTAVFEIDIVVNDFVNAAGNGGLHGIKHA